MKIAVNTRLLIKDKLEGIGWFSYETLKRITKKHPEHEFFFIFDRKYSNEFIFSENVIPIVAFPPTRHPLLTEFYFEYTLPIIIRKIKPDLFFSPDGWVPRKINIPIHNVIHDLNFEHFPEFLPKYALKHFTKYFPKYAKRSNRIATVSYYTKQDLINTYGIDGKKIDVVYNGANEIFKPISFDEQKKIREKYTNGSSYFIFVSSIHPRKNLENTLKAFFKFKENTKNNVKFVIIGSVMWKSQNLKKILDKAKFNDDVIFMGHIDVETLHKLIGAAEALVYVSFFEGFGIPIIEAMRCGTPVITSDVTSMPEVAGDAALLVSPYKFEEISFAMKKIFYDRKLKNDLKLKGLERSKSFSWDKTANFLWDSINKLL